MKKETFYELNLLLNDLFIPEPLWIPDRIRLDLSQRALQCHGRSLDEEGFLLTDLIGDHSKLVSLRTKNYKVKIEA